MSILIKLASSRNEYSDQAVSLIMEQMRLSPTNQLPMYAENAVSVIREKDRDVFLRTLSSRLGDIEKESKRRRIEKVIAKLSRRVA